MSIGGWRCAALMYPFTLVFALFFVLPPAGAQAPLMQLDIIVPGSPGGGFDKNAQALARALRAEKIVDRIEIRHSPGAGGLIALARFEAAPAPAVPTIFIGGTTILGAAAQNRSVVSLGDLLPISQLNEIALVIVVRSDGPVASFGELVLLTQTQDNRFEWVGGSPGSADELLLLALAQKLDLPRERFSFIANPGGGAAVSERLLSGRHLAAISSFEELASSPDLSKLRMLAVSTERRLPGIDVPTLREQGVDLALSDWKGVFASRRSSPRQIDEIRHMMARALASKSWSRELADNRWTATKTTPESFPAFISQRQQEAERLIAYTAGNRQPDAFYRGILDRPWRYVLLAVVVAGLLAAVVVLQRRSGKRREAEFKRSERELDDMRNRIMSESSGERSEITRQLGEWSLSAAEIEIGWMILKGLQFKEIAAARGTSERTVRQQAQAIYAKSGLTSRTEFSAFFLENLRF